jgi:hypothetical protein
MNGRGVASVVDLSDKLELTATLLSDPHAWRHRVVEEVTITTTLHYQVWRSYQVLLPDEIIRPLPLWGFGCGACACPAPSRHPAQAPAPCLSSAGARWETPLP